jgi:hypothetical protein
VVGSVFHPLYRVLLLFTPVAAVDLAITTIPALLSPVQVERVAVVGLHLH